MEIPEALLIFTLVLSYSLVAPVITPFGFIYFVLVYVINRYNLIYANQAKWQGGGDNFFSPRAEIGLNFFSRPSFNILFFLPGSVWPIIYHCMMAAVLLFQLLMVGILSKLLPSFHPYNCSITLTFAFSFKRFKPVRQWRHIGTFAIHHRGSLGRYTSAVDI